MGPPDEPVTHVRSLPPSSATWRSRSTEPGTDGRTTRYSRFSLGYVYATETPGWSFEGMFGSGLWTWVHDQGVGGSYLIETNRDPGTISVGVARLR